MSRYTPTAHLIEERLGYETFFWSIGHIRTTEPIVAYCRVSTRQQASRDNLRIRKSHLRTALERRGYRVLAVWGEVSHGWCQDWEFERGQLANAVKQAKEVGGVVVAHSADRFLRSSDYHASDNPDILPTADEYRRFNDFVGDVPLATLWGPELDGRTVNKLWSQASIETRGSRVGRPMKRATRRAIWEPQIPELRSQGLTWHQIAELIGCTTQTLHRWMRQH